jgi:hypothetical protein
MAMISGFVTVIADIFAGDSAFAGREGRVCLTCNEGGISVALPTGSGKTSEGDFR